VLGRLAVHTTVTEAELTMLWRVEQVLHAMARVMRERELEEASLGYSYLAVCGCAEGIQTLAGKIQRERLEQ